MSRTKVFVCYGLMLVYGLILRLLVFVPRETYFDADLARWENYSFCLILTVIWNLKISSGFFKQNYFYWHFRVMDMSNDILENTYYTIYTRVLPFFSGILLAHVLDQAIDCFPFKNEKVKNDCLLKNPWVFCLRLIWLSFLCFALQVKKFIIGFVFYLSIIFILIFPFLRLRQKYFEIIFGLLWIIATNVIIYVCHRGHGGLINAFLSLKIWIPLSKMALSIYLVSLCHQGATTLVRMSPFSTVTLGDIVSL